MEWKIDSSESESIYDSIIKDKMEELVEEVIEAGIESDGQNVEIDAGNVTAPTFTYDNEGSGQGGGGQGPGNQGGGGVKFTMPMDKFMDLVANALNLPNLTKEGKGKIKEVSYVYKTFGNTGIILDKKRTFKQALKSSIGQKIYDPSEGKYDVSIRRKDKRFKLPEKVENPKFKAVVFFAADISYSTYGERLKLEKKYVNFIKTWLTYNYGKGNVEFRYFVHDADAYEVPESKFFHVDNVGGTQALPVFELINEISINEYNPIATNMYTFYFGDGELFSSDIENIEKMLWTMSKNMNRIAITEVLPSSYSRMIKDLEGYVHDEIKLIKAKKDKGDIIKNIKKMFK